MEASDSAEKALRRAGYILSRRSYSKQELFDKLCEKGESESDAAYAVARLAELSVLNDEAYARAILENYSARGYGIHRVRQELVKRGIPRDMVGDILCDTPDPTDNICTLIKNKLRSKDPDRKEVKRITDFLARRGYSYDEISPALRKTISKDEFED